MVAGNQSRHMGAVSHFKHPIGRGTRCAHRLTVETRLINDGIHHANPVGIAQRQIERQRFQPIATRKSADSAIAGEGTQLRVSKG